jgi:hypothetical protein
MPEQLTKHPEVTLQVLRSAGAQCGEGAPQDILTKCPEKSFCKLPGGELCVFGLGDASKMTQITAAEWKAVSVANVAEPGPAPQASFAAGWLSVLAGTLLGLVIGLAIAYVVRKPWAS